jgi:hypothetical protein
MSEEKQDGVIFTPKIEEEGRIDEFPLIKEVDVEDKIIEVTPSVQSVIPPEELQKINDEIKAEIEAEEKNEGAIGGAVEGADDSADDLNKKTYVKITPTLYIKPAGSEKNKEGEDVKLYKVLNPETNIVEKRVLTDAEKHDVLVRDIKESHIRFRPIKRGVKREVVGTKTIQYGSREKKVEVKSDTVLTNVTTNQFGADYRKKRKNKNRMARASRKASR